MQRSTAWQSAPPRMWSTCSRAAGQTRAWWSTKPFFPAPMFKRRPMSEPVPSKAGWPVGFAVNPRVNTLSTELIEAYRSVPVCHAGDVMGRHTGARGAKMYHHDLALVTCGPAVTVRIRPGDNLMVHLAMMMAEPGDVIVIDGGADLSTAVIGGLMRTTAVARKLGGFLLDGALRDVAEWAEGGMPAYAA